MVFLVRLVLFCFITIPTYSLVIQISVSEKQFNNKTYIHTYTGSYVCKYVMLLDSYL